MGGVLLFALGMVLTVLSARAEDLLVTEPSSGREFKAYAAGPNEAQAGVVILHDWFGVTDFTKESVERLGKNGIRTIAVDLYDGQSAETHEQAQKLSGELDLDHAQFGVMAGLEALDARQRPVIVVGYSMGGRIALRAATERPDLIRAVALIYGGGFEGIDDQKLALAGPILAVTGSADEWSYAEHANLEKRARDLGQHLEIYVYPGADHAFAQRLYNEGKSYDPAATEAMRNVLDAFIERNTGPST